MRIPQTDKLEFHRSWMYAFFVHLWSDHFKRDVDSMSPQEYQVRHTVRDVFLKGEWWEVYDVLEFAINSPNNANRESLDTAVAQILNEEMAGFRLINGQFIEITDESEIAAIEEALETSGRDKFLPARAHLFSALQHLSNRRSPDYRNSIKESISAVEAIAQILSGNSQAELSDALKLLEKGAPLHGAFRKALLSLYGYTSDADGIRHALTEEPNLDAADAKFMLVTCSAFVVYLIQKGVLARGAT